MSHAWSGADPTQSSDNGSYSLGATFQANDAITVTGVRVWAGASPGVRASRRGRLWTTSEAQLAIATMPDTLPTGYSEYDFATPVDMTVGEQATVAWDTGGFYGELNAAFDNPVVSTDGAVTFLAGAAAPHGNGAFTTSVGQYPDVAAAQHTWYGVDIVYTITGGNTPPTIVGMTAVADGLTVTATINATDQEGLVGATYGIDWGDGATQSGSVNTASHTYEQDGTFAVLGSVTDSGGLSAFAARPVAVGGTEAAGFDADAIMAALTTIAQKTGLFDSVSGHEPASLPSAGMTAAIWIQGIGPAKKLSGLSATAARVEYRMRLYTPMITGDMDAIDPNMTTAVVLIMLLLSQNFTLGGLVYQVDLLGAHGAPLGAKPDYYKQADAFYRIFDITVPLVMDNVWSQGAVS